VKENTLLLYLEGIRESSLSDASRLGRFGKSIKKGMEITIRSG
jgi:hypothetical protein